MKPRAMKKKMMRGGGAVKKPAAKMMRGGGAVKKPAAKMMRGGTTALPGGLPKRSRLSNTEAFKRRTELNKKAQAARAAGRPVNATTAIKRANAAIALERKRKNAADALKSRRDEARDALNLRRAKAKKPVAKKPVAKKPVVKKPSKSDPKREVAYGSSFVDDSGMYTPKKRVSPSSKASKAIGSAKMMRGGMKKPVAKMRGGGMKKPVAKMRGGGLKKK
jgi:hypothetical protein